VCKSDENSEVQSEWFTTEFLNNIKCSGIPNHKSRFKVGCPIMLMRNIDQAARLCNGTKLIVNNLGKNFISATVITGKNAGEIVIILRMKLVPSDPGLPFKFTKRQFPLALCFAMTINKSQGQSLSHVGIYLSKPVFTLGQLYIVVSRVTSKTVCVLKPLMLCTVMFFGTFNRSFLMTQVGMSFFFSFKLCCNIYF